MPRRKSPRKTARLAVCLSVLATAGAPQAWAAAAYPSGQVNVSGATLFRDFFAAPASTNDWVDVDGDGVFGFNPDTGETDQLATDPTIHNPGNPATYNVTFSVPTYWQVDYRGVGSGNGLKEMVNDQLARLNGSSNIPTSVPAEGGLFNRKAYATQLGVLDPAIANPNNPSGAPVTQTSIDVGVMDVPTTWFVQAGSSSSAAWNRKPTQTGYGTNAAASSTGESNKLKTLADSSHPAYGSLNTNTASPDNRTIFDTPIAWVPIAFIANPGTGIDADANGTADGNLSMTELEHLYVTGRMTNGENLMAVTRDAGSGTRNGAMNSIGVDPSFGVGDNVGAKNDDINKDKIGANFLSNNKGGSSGMERTVEYARLAVGYTGLAGASRAAEDAVAGRYEILNVKKDIDGDGNGSADGTQYVRPAAENVLDNADADNGWQIGGPETFATVGDPNASRPVGDPLKTTSPAMASAVAAGYVNNIVDSIADFVEVPTDVSNIGSPGEYLASTFTLVAAVQSQPLATNPTNFQATPGFNQSLNDESQALLAGTLNVPAFGAVNGGAGKVPTRDNTANYTDNAGVNVNSYKTVDGTLLNYGTNLNLRNKIAGDFNNDGKRSTADVAGMMAWAKYRGLAGATAGGAMPESGTGLSLEILGDFNADGNFNEKDVRYWADGLHLAGGQLDRKAGFTSIDTQWNALTADNNFFNTAKATGTAYQAGDARGDVAGLPVTKGASPAGANGAINAADIDYVYAQFKTNSFVTDGQANWANLNEAAGFDLSADMTGDLIVDQNDVDELVRNILNTDYGDANLDGLVDAADYTIYTTNLGATAAGWALADFTGDKTVDAADRLLWWAAAGMQGDFNGDGTVTLSDINPFKLALTDTAAWQTEFPSVILDGVDPNGDGIITLSDINPFKAILTGGSGAEVPEPATLILLAVGAMAMAHRR
ncbi:MAG: PEP-CTERM sorting domain-containing protein [Phycisphaeraceae bacterium]|nr:PEP-CTERM sorting domain-containing protein [Phycisphaeraceae bacterium]